MEASNGSAFLPLLAVLELLGLKISWFLIRIEEMDKSMNFGLPKLALDLVSMNLMAGLMNSGYNFRVEFPLVVSVDKIPLVVRVATFGSLFGSLPFTTECSESFNTSTSSKVLNPFLGIAYVVNLFV